jgi:hypothetical protein
VWSNLFWVVLVPASTLAAATVAIRGGSWSGAAVAIAVAVGLHLVSWLRIVSSARRRWPADDAALYASFCLLARWAAMQGMLVYWWRRLRRSERRLIEYKDTRPA